VPSEFVVVPFFDPFNTTLTPGSGLFLLSVTFPETVRKGDLALSNIGRQIETKRKQPICLRKLPRMAIGGSSCCSVLNISQALVLQKSFGITCRVIKQFSIEKLVQ
jgi:hypothetical protein